MIQKLKNRVEIGRVTKCLAPLTQNGVITAEEAGKIATAYVKGDNEPLQELCNSPEIPMIFWPFVIELKNYV